MIARALKRFLNRKMMAQWDSRMVGCALTFIKSISQTLGLPVLMALVTVTLIIPGPAVMSNPISKRLPCSCTEDREITLEAPFLRGTDVLGIQRLLPEEPLTLVIDTEERTLTVYSRGRPFKRYIVAVGKPSTPSPPGEWTVVKKSSWSGGFGTRWMGLDVPWGIYGIHGTNKPWSIGDAVSGGCIRMHNQHVEELFQWVKTGTRVKIIGHPYDPLRNPRRLLGPGERGADVLLAERRLDRLGYKVGKVDGVYDEDTVKAVKEFQKASRLRISGEITQEVYDALGMYLFE